MSFALTWLGVWATAPLTVTEVHGAEVVISEIMYHPGFGSPGAEGYVPEDRRQEFVELHNPGLAPVNLKDWRLRGVGFVFPDVTIAAGGYLVVAADSDTIRFKEAYATNYPPVANAMIVGGCAGSLANNGEEIELENHLGQRVDWVAYAAQGEWAERREGEPHPGKPSWWRGWRWATAADAGGRSLELLNPALPNEHGQNWAASLNEGGTPGGPNSRTASDLPPMILQVSHAPPVPKSNQSVTVVARVVDERPSTVLLTVSHRLDGQAEYLTSPMFDDGFHGDGAAGDGLFGVILPAQPDRTVVEFYVRGVDAGGQVRTWPGATDEQGTQGANALYQVDDSPASLTQPTYRLIVRTAEWADWVNLMDNTSGGRYSDAQMNGTLVTQDGLGAEVRYLVGIRNRGAGTRSARPHNLHVNIPADRPWRNRTSLSLNTRTVHSQVAGNALATLAGLPNELGAPVQVRINGTNLANPTPTGGTDSYQFGSYYCFQAYSSEWAKTQFPADPDGNIYRGVWFFDGVRLNNAADLRYLGEDPGAYRQLYASTGATAATGPYTKQSNNSEDDWSDLIGLAWVLNHAPDSNYVEEVAAVVNVEQWLRYLAVTTLVGNMETTLGAGAGDDFSLYRGIDDPRFQILSHDLDTTLGQGDAGPDYGRSIFKAADLPVISRFLKHPAITPRYFAMLKELCDTTFSSEQADPLLDRVLGGWVPDPYIRSMKDFVARRRAAVLAQIPLTLSATSPLASSHGYLLATNSTLSLSGRAHAIRSRSVRVMGVVAGWTQWTASWSADKLKLRPGLNRVLIQALDEHGNEIDRASLDVWYDPGAITTVGGGTLDADATWTSAGAPYRLTAPLTVPAGRTLTIEPGTTVYFDEGAGLSVSGRLVAEGTEYERIRFTRLPGSLARGGGFVFADSRESNVLAYADIEFADAGASVISVLNSQLLLDHVTIANHNAETITLKEPQVMLRHSVLAGPGAHASLTAEGLRPDGWLIVDGNFFGASSGTNDVLRLVRASQKDGPRPQIINNVFQGSGFNILGAYETDAHIEGNLFMHARGEGSGARAAAVTTGPADAAGTPNLATQRLTIVRNVFFENDCAVLSQTGSFSLMYHNVFVGNRRAVLFDQPSRADLSPGRGAYIESCIFWDNGPEDETAGTGVLVHVNNRSPEGRTQLVVNHSILPATFHQYGAGNLEADPRFLRPAVVSPLSAALPRLSTGFEGWQASTYFLQEGWAPDVQLHPTSPARGTGFNGVDMGSYVAANASLAGVPASSTWQEPITITVGGADLQAYRYRLIGPGFTNDWSGPRAQLKKVDSIVRVGATARATAPGHGYANGDLVEIAGAPAAAYNGRFRVFNVTTDTFDYEVSAMPPDQPPPQDISCRRPEAIQLSGLALGPYTLEVIRQNSLGIWQSQENPTVGAWTVVAPPGGAVRLNEILARNLGAYAHDGAVPDAVELYNPGAQPIDLSGMILSDDPLVRFKFVFPGGATLGAGQYLVLDADSNFTAPGFHLGFKLNQSGDALFLYDRLSDGGALLDSVSFGLQLPDLSIGRLADGRWSLTRPTLGAANVAQPLGDPRALRVNEWLVRGQGVYAAGFIELFNPDPLPVSLGGLRLAAGVFVQPAQAALAPLSFIAGRGFALFHPDGQPAGGADHLDFKLLPGPGAIGLFAEDLSPIDRVFYGSQSRDFSQGRSPNAALTWAFFNQPTPGVGNPAPAAITNVITQDFVLITMTNFWRYNQTDELSGAWYGPAYTADAPWPTNQALFYVETSSLPAPKLTPLTLGRNTYYFRTDFTLPTNLTGAELRLFSIVDDGAVFYLNGRDVLRIHMPTNEVDYATAARDHEAALEGPFLVPATNLIAGRNLLAVEVHQVDSGSSDIVFGMSLEATLRITNIIGLPEPARVLLNEVLADNGSLTNEPGLAADWIELFNPSNQAVHLSDMSLTDELQTPRKWVFPPDSFLAPGGHLVISCDGGAPVSATNTGFGLKASGAAVYLLASLANDSIVVDSLSFGLQAQDFSLGRVGEPGQWTLTVPTPREANRPAALGDSSLLKINEWMADPLAGEDWFELYNPDSRPVELSGLHLTDDLTDPTQSRIPDRSFIGVGPGAYQQFQAAGSTAKGANHAGFKLSAGGDLIALFRTNDVLIDLVRFGPQRLGVSEGRLPDGHPTVTAFPGSATPGLANTKNLAADSDGDGLPDAWESAHGLLLNDPSDAQRDSDGDGATNLAEYLAGTDPRNAFSALRLGVEVVTGNTVFLRFVSVAGKTYSLQYRDSLSSGAWSNLPGLTLPPGGGLVTVPDLSAEGAAARYYRVVTPAVP